MRVLGAPTPRPFRRSAVLANRVFRRLILGFAISFLGDGMSFVPVAWLAIQRRRPPRGCGSAARGSAGKYTLLAELLPDERRFAANTLVSSLNFAAPIAGPAIAGALVTCVSSALVLVPPRTRSPTCSSPCSSNGCGCRRRGTSPSSTRRPPAAGSGCCGPSPAARAADAHLVLQPPVRIRRGRAAATCDRRPASTGHAARRLLVLFGIGAVLGGLAVGALRQLPLWPVTVVIVVA